MNSDPAASQHGHDPSPVEHSGGPVQALVGLATAVATALSGVYVTTRSVMVTVLVAVLIAVLAVCVLWHRPHWRR
jgi:membrane protein YdbS with pleckstrin-like domain